MSISRRTFLKSCAVAAVFGGAAYKGYDSYLKENKDSIIKQTAENFSDKSPEQVADAVDAVVDSGRVQTKMGIISGAVGGALSVWMLQSHDND